jgi:hypothetical protein
MATRTIVTSQPDVACDVCERRLLRGENWDIYVVAGRRRTVCELCAPRAAYEGWRRESETASPTLPPMRPRRGRSFFERLRQVGKPGEGGDPAEQATMADPVPAAAPTGAAEPSPYNFLDGYAATATPAGSSETAAAGPAPVPAAPSSATEEVDESDWYLQRAVELFNQSEYPRRVAGVSRSLGPAQVSVCAAEHLSSVVLIVVAWELCWYRYEVDLSVEGAEATAVAQGTELSELTREERSVNAAAGESGELSLTSL